MNTQSTWAALHRTGDSVTLQLFFHSCGKNFLTVMASLTLILVYWCPGWSVVGSPWRRERFAMPCVDFHSKLLSPHKWKVLSNANNQQHFLVEKEKKAQQFSLLCFEWPHVLQWISMWPFSFTWCLLVGPTEWLRLGPSSWAIASLTNVYISGISE